MTFDLFHLLGVHGSVVQTDLLINATVIPPTRREWLLFETLVCACRNKGVGSLCFTVEPASLRHEPELTGVTHHVTLPA
jgi:hypothetical protein